MQAPRNSGEAESHGLSLHDVQAAVSSQLAPVLEAFQELSGRMMSYENNMSRNYTETPQTSQPPQARLTLPVPLPDSQILLEEQLIHQAGMIQDGEMMTMMKMRKS